jgi:hypothetical protein
MKTESQTSLSWFTCPGWHGLWRPGTALFLALAVPLASAHIVPPEKLHPIAENYWRASFILNVIPVAWDQVDPEIVALAEYWKTIDAPAADNFLRSGQSLSLKSFPSRLATCASNNPVPSMTAGIARKSSPDDPDHECSFPPPPQIGAMNPCGFVAPVFQPATRAD